MICEECWRKADLISAANLRPKIEVYLQLHEDHVMDSLELVIAVDDDEVLIRIDNLDLVIAVRDIIDSNRDDPAAEMIKQGEALIRIGKTLEQLPNAKAMAIIDAVCCREL